VTRFESIRNAAIEFGPPLVGRHFKVSCPIAKLSHKLSTAHWPQAAADALTRQVHQRHVLTLWDTT